MYISKNTVHAELYVVRPSRQHMRYARLAQKGTLPDRLTRYDNFMSLVEALILFVFGWVIALVTVVLGVIVETLFLPATVWVLYVGFGFATTVGVGIPVLAFIYFVTASIVQRVHRPQWHWADKLMRLPRTFELDGSNARPAILAVGPDWIRQHAGNYGGKIDDFLCDPTVIEAEALMRRVDPGHPAYSAAARKLRLIADGNLHSTVLELEQARYEVEVARVAAEAQQEADRKQQDIDALREFTTSDLNTKVTVADVVRGRLT